MNQARITAEFVGVTCSRIFVLAHHPASFDGRCMLICPPFAEEMNKSRKMLTELSRLLVAQGMAVVIPDLFGTGDSDGDFADASWERWLTDLQTTEQWIKSKGWRLDSMLGIRLGCILASQYAASRQRPLSRTIFWQPVIDGARALEQFLRLRVAASLMSDAKESIVDLKARLTAIEVVEVAGYDLAPLLASELTTLKLMNHISSHIGELHWFEVVRSADAPLPIPSVKVIERLKLQMVVEVQSMIGEPFWATTEIVCLPDLVANTAAAIAGVANHG